MILTGGTSEYREPKKVFIRPPDHWDELSDDEQLAWAMGLVVRLVAEQPPPRP